MSTIETVNEPNLDENIEDSVINEANADILNKANEKVAKLKENKVDGAIDLDGHEEIDSDKLDSTKDLETDSDNLENKEDIVEENEVNEDDDEVITLTKKELRAQKDSEADKRVLKVLEKKQKEWDIEKDKLLSEKKQEFEKYSSLTDSEKKQKDLDDKIAEIELEKVKLKESLDEVEKNRLEHEDKVKQFNDERLLENIKADLALNELPINLAPILFKLNDAEQIKLAVEELKVEFGSIIKNKTAKYSQTKTPKVSNTVINNSKHRKSTSDLILDSRKAHKK